MEWLSNKKMEISLVLFAKLIKLMIKSAKNVYVLRELSLLVSSNV